MATVIRFHLASGNAHKAAEFQALADASRAAGRGCIEIVSARAVGGMPHVEEDTGTFAGNARKKALALHARLPPGAWALADDSGLCVDALGGGPGVESAYYAGPEGDFAANLRKLIEALREVPDGNRGAHFLCVLVVRGPDGAERVFEGRCAGRLLLAPRGGSGFGYDPLFVPVGHDRSFSEMSEAQKNRISHRALAWAKLAEFFAGRKSLFQSPAHPTMSSIK